jgi:AAA15 family ATPase/GTPase
MLLRFACRNFRSLRDEQELSLVATSGHEHEENLVAVPAIKNRVVRSAAIYGANASGKTNFLRALSFFDATVENSHSGRGPDSKIPRQQFKLNDKQDEPSYFEADFLLNGERFTFGFELDDSKIIREWMYAFPSGRKVIWYEREVGKPISFGRSFTGRNKAIEALTRKNSLFLSAAAQNNHELLSPIFEWFNQGFYLVNPEYRTPFDTAEICSNDREIQDSVRSWLHFADLGIIDFTVDDEEVDQKMKEVLGLIFKGRNGNDSQYEPPSTRKKIALLHQGALSKSFTIDAAEESHGTIAYFSILGPILRALSKGSVLLIDELDSSLHPVLAKEIVRLFNDPKLNCRGAQFIFTTHDANLLSLDILRRDQIWFAEKDREGASSLYPLSEFSVRSDYNIQRGYLQGRFGAIPFLNESFVKDLERLGCEQNG